jgi:uncharacterized protein YcbK (DUF882 family)
VPHFRHNPLFKSRLIKVGHHHARLIIGVRGDPKSEGDSVLRYPTAPKSIGLSVWLAFCLLLVLIAAIPAGPADARERDRTLKLYFGHTGERGEFTFKRNGRYDRSEIRRINHLLRDWRRNEDADMDPKLLDLIWSIYRETGSREYIHVVSAYRSLATNDQLRRRSSGVAKRSQHTAGKALDFYIPGVPLANLRAAAMRFQGGGVGYYPSSGSPFVHVDTGSVRSWPRMTRSQLLALFPNGETLYLPADGTPLPGYERARARRQSSGDTALAYLEAEDTEEERSGGGWLSRVFGNAGDAEDVQPATTAVASRAPAPAASQTPVPPAAAEPQMLVALPEIVEPRTPRARPSTGVEMMVAQAAADLPAAVVEPDDRLAMASIADIPLPRSRPDAALLADSLASEASGLAVGTEDALAILAARAQENLAAAAQDAGEAALELALVSQESETVLPSAADSAVLAGFAVLEEPTAATSGNDSALAAANALSAEGYFTPHPRPMTLAFAGAGLPTSELPAGFAPAPAPAASPTPVQPAAPEADYDADSDTLRLLIGTPATQDEEFARFAMPQPAGAPGLFTAPESVSAVTDLSGTLKLPIDRFEVAGIPAQESFFSRLFASLVE